MVKNFSGFSFHIVQAVCVLSTGDESLSRIGVRSKQTEGKFSSLPLLLYIGGFSR